MGRIDMASIDFNHARNRHSADGPLAAWPILLKVTQPKSVLDVGCGVGYWLKSALECGVTDVLGVDGVPIPPNELLFPSSYFRVHDFTRTLSLNRRFDLALCLEVAEHLPASAAPTLIDSLVSHSDTVIFSAASPHQQGQNHIHLQWPAYWQSLFNERGFSCSDEIRPLIWDESRIEPWYRQNIFLARRAPTGQAGNEPRLLSMIHPELIPPIIDFSIEKYRADIWTGKMSAAWYFKMPFIALRHKLARD